MVNYLYLHFIVCVCGVHVFYIILFLLYVVFFSFYLSLLLLFYKNSHMLNKIILHFFTLFHF